MTQNNTFSVTENASKRIQELLSEEDNQDVRLRISVLGGGCSGFQYNFEFDNAMDAEDQQFGSDDAPVIIDTTSLEFIKGSSLDFVETLGSAAFEIKNPQATAQCGCGNSFSV